MKIKIYDVNEHTTPEMLKSIECEITGRMIDATELIFDKRHDPTGTVPCGAERGGPRLFEYKYDNSYKNSFPKLKLNFLFHVFQSTDPDDDSFLTNHWGYIHLNFFQQIQLGWTFRKCWIQKSENLKWLACILISIFVSGLITLLTK